MSTLNCSYLPATVALFVVIFGTVTSNVTYAQENGQDTEHTKEFVVANHSPAKLIETLYQLFANGEVEATFELVSDDYRMFEPGPVDVLPWAGEFVGRQGFMEFNQRLIDSLVDMSMEDLRFEDIGKGRVMVTGTEKATSIATGRSYVTSSLWIWEVHNGRIISMRAYHDTEAMTAAFRSSADN